MKDAPYIPSFDILNTRFIYRTNFAGDPAKNLNGKPQRIANIMLTDMDMVNELKENGILVKYKPADTQYGEVALDGENCYFVKAMISFNGNANPNVKLVTQGYDGSKSEVLDGETIGILDHVSVKSVSVTLSPSWFEAGNRSGWVLWIRNLKVWGQPRQTAAFMEDEDDMSF